MEIKYSINEISSVNDRLIEEFSCGNMVIDNCLKKARVSAGATLVVIDEIAGHIVAFCTYTTSGLSKMVSDYVNNKCIKYRVTYPAAEIKYFAVDEKYQHMSYDNEDDNYKISDHFLCEIIRRLSVISDKIIYFEYVILYSVPDAVSFYKRNNFEEFTEYMEHDAHYHIENCTPMFLAL